MGNIGIKCGFTQCLFGAMPQVLLGSRGSQLACFIVIGSCTKEGWWFSAGDGFREEILSQYWSFLQRIGTKEAPNWNWKNVPENERLVFIRYEACFPSHGKGCSFG